MTITDDSGQDVYARTHDASPTRLFQVLNFVDCLLMLPQPVGDCYLMLALFLFKITTDVTVICT